MLKHSHSSIFLAVVLFVSCGCSAQKPNMIGHYKSKKYSLVAQGYFLLFKNTSNFVVNSSLDLKADSTYHYVTCGGVSDGKWEIRQDSLLLFCESNKWSIDSFNKTGFNGQFLKCQENPDIYKIEKGVLKQKWKRKGKDQTILNYFVKEK